MNLKWAILFIFGIFLFNAAAQAQSAPPSGLKINTCKTDDENFGLAIISRFRASKHLYVSQLKGIENHRFVGNLRIQDGKLKGRSELELYNQDGIWQLKESEQKFYIEVSRNNPKLMKIKFDKGAVVEGLCK